MHEISGRPCGFGNRIEQVINLEYYATVYGLEITYYWNNIQGKNRDNVKINFTSENVNIDYYKNQKNTITFWDFLKKFNNHKVVNSKLLELSSNIKPRFDINIPEDTLGVHIRGTDRITNNNHPHYMKSKNEYNFYINEALKKVCSIKPKKLFICGDDDFEIQKFKKEVLKKINTNIINLENTNNVDSSVLDFFALSKCKEILKATKFSSFSSCAAMVGNCPIYTKNKDHNVFDRYPNNWVLF